MMPTVAMQLRDIAGNLQSKVEEGEFDCCKEYAQADMQALPAALNRIARQAEKAARLAAPAASHKPANAPDGIGKRIVAARKAVGMTQATLAAALGLSRSAVAQWETDRAAPTYAHLLRLNKTLRADLLKNPEAS